MDFQTRLTQKTLAIDTVTVDGTNYTYRVVRSDIEPRLRYFVGMSGGMPFLSEDIPIRFRPFVVYHEALCTQVYAGKKGRCLKALKQELLCVPRSWQPEYIRMRLEFFSKLVRLLKDKHDREMLAELRESLVYLRSQAR